jgi:hypothetical protein
LPARFAEFAAHEGRQALLGLRPFRRAARAL